MFQAKLENISSMKWKIILKDCQKIKRNVSGTITENELKNNLKWLSKNLYDYKSKYGYEITWGRFHT